MSRELKKISDYLKVSRRAHSQRLDNELSLTAKFKVMKNSTKYLIVLFAFVLFFLPESYAGWVSPFPSTVQGISIPNTHVLLEGRYESGGGAIVRGMAPFKDRHFRELMSYGVEHVLIFKKQSRTEVDKEITILKRLGMSEENYTHIPFRWRRFPSTELACRQTVQALKILHDNFINGKTTFVHCTVGEDRTGHLAALLRLMTSDSHEVEAIEGVFFNQMCENGYGAGNPLKPLKKVVKFIRSDLTPIFLQMAHKVRIGKLTWERLSLAACSDFLSKGELERRYPAENFRCNRSSKMPKN